MLLRVHSITSYTHTCTHTRANTVEYMFCRYKYIYIFYCRVHAHVQHATVFVSLFWMEIPYTRISVYRFNNSMLILTAWCVAGALATSTRAHCRRWWCAWRWSTRMRTTGQWCARGRRRWWSGSEASTSSAATTWTTGRAKWASSAARSATVRTRRSCGASSATAISWSATWSTRSAEFSSVRSLLNSITQIPQLKLQYYRIVMLYLYEYTRTLILFVS